MPISVAIGQRRLLAEFAAKNSGCYCPILFNMGAVSMRVPMPSFWLLVGLVVLSRVTSHAQDFVPEFDALIDPTSSGNVEWVSASFAEHGCSAGCSCFEEYVPHPTTCPNCTHFRFPSYDPEHGIKLLDPVDPEATPFAMNFTGNAEFRYAAFMRSEDSAVDATGAVQDIRNKQGLLAPRMWFQFDGYMGHPNILYNFVLFGTTGKGDSVSILGGPGYKWGEKQEVFMAVLKMPACREWVESYRWHFGVDRSMATTFFRPSFTPGAFFYGEIGETVNYSVAMTNGINGVEFGTDRPGNNMAYAVSPTWEPLGDYGPGFSDVEYHEDLVVRLGTSLAAAPNSTINKEDVDGNPDNTLVRLSDGTSLGTTGALGPGVTVNQLDWYLAAIDLGFKYRGHSISGEYFYRYLDDIKTTGGPPSRSTLNDNGGYLYGALNLVPNYLEFIAKAGYTSGPYGSSEEYGGGFNWFLTGNRRQRLVVEAIHYNNSAADNDITPYRAFYSGTIAQMEYYVQF
jgi:hypothetical protein